MLSHNELKEKLEKIIKTYNDKGEGDAIKVLEDIIQEEKSKMADLGFKAVMATIETVAENM